MRRLPGQRFHARPIDLAGLVERYQQRFRRGFDPLNWAIPLQRAAIEDRSLGRPLCLGVEFLQGQQKRLVRIIGKRFHVLPRVERPEAGNEEIVRSVQMAAGLDDGFIRGLGKLGAEHLAHRVTDLKHSANPCANRSRERRAARTRRRGEQRSGHRDRPAHLL